MYPLKFTKVLKEKVWGGREFEQLFNLPLPLWKNFGESWEVSAHPHGPSVVAEGPWAGKTLVELIGQEGPRLLGKNLFDRFGGRFPLLIKYLDIHDKLSIQVHPGDDYALGYEREFGKSECWYILAATPDAKLVLGVIPGVTRQTFAEKSSEGSWDGLFREVPVAAGDFVHIPPGTVHASLAGTILLCEIQQNSDTTYRIYDFDRLENGKPRPLHLDKALDVIDFSRVPQITSLGSRPRKAVQGAEIESLVVDPYFTVDRIVVSDTFSEPEEDRFRIFSVIGGSGTLVHRGTDYPFRSGDTWFLPAGLGVRLQGKLEVLRSVV